MEFEIRVAKNPNDVFGLLAVRKSFGLSPQEAEKKRETYLEDLTDEQSRVCLIATDVHGRTIGFVQLVWQREDLSEGEVCLHDLRVKANHQSRGVGRALISQIESLAEERGFDSIWLWVEKSNFRALNLYERAGYEILDVLPSRPEFADCFRMGKRLAINAFS